MENQNILKVIPMLSDPQSLTIDGTANSLPATGRGVNTSSYLKDDSTIGFTVTHTYKGRTRREIRVDFSKIAADPLVSAQNIKYTTSVYFVINEPVTGFTVTERYKVAAGLTKWLTDSSGANLIKVLGGES